ncbi:hypothetical protein JG688_00009365 [Phytophthora aleatoria]|uniref:Uncharacterized protein n=1 Tax=Phytophthora aleatoria TaxID=2496075 RepID=A0A8J5M422_9STRA|nr:hypothetical protein JG688_00009365 [Phytophthora aleatoria]
MKRMARIFTDTTAAPLHHHFSGLYPLPRATADEMSWSLQSADSPSVIALASDQRSLVSIPPKNHEAFVNIRTVCYACERVFLGIIVTF